MTTILKQRPVSATIFAIVCVLLCSSCAGRVDPAASDSIADVTISSASVLFGNQNVGTTSPAQSVTLTNSSKTAVSITSISVTGSAAADFSLTNTCGNSVPPGTSCVASITFTPSATGTRTALVTITDSVASSPQMVTLSGTGVASAFQDSTSNLDFGTVLVGTTSGSQNVTVTNSGTTNLIIATAALSGVNEADFAKRTDTCSGATIAASSSCVVTVTFTPTGTGTRNAALSFEDNAGGSPQSVSLTGIGNNPAPGLSSLSPASGVVGTGAQTLTLTGANFLSSSTVTYNGVGHAATFVSSTTLTISLSTGDQATAGSYPVVVTNPGPGGGTSSPVNFTVTATNPVPSLSSLSPASGVVGTGAQTLTLTGANFLSSSTVTYNGVGHAATFVSSTTLTISLSTGDQATAGSYPVVVTNPGPGGGTSSPVNFTVTATNPVPSLNSLSPASGVVGTGAQTLTLTGANFLSSSTVTYNGVGHAATFVSSTTLTISLSTGDQATAGSYPVVVTNPGPGGGTSSPVNFTVTATNPVPSLNSLSPASGVVGTGAQTLTLTGANFLSSSTVTYNGVGHAATFVSSTTLTISLSTGDQATAGSYPVVVTNPGPGGGTSSPVNFTVTATNPVPSLNSLSPASGVVGTGAQTLTLTGANFLSSSTVTYNGVGHAATFVSSTTLTISLSTGDQATAGSYPVVVTNPGPGGGTSSPVNFTVTTNNPVPSISSLSPATVIAGAGPQTLTVTGTNFLSTSTVTYNGVGHVATFVSSTTLTISLSTGDQATAGNYAVVVTNPGPGGGSSTPLNFIINTSNPVPTLNSLSPASANAGAGAQTLTLTGTNFLSSSTVTYNGVGHAATFISSTQLTISLSTGDQATAGSYPVVVTNPAPGGGTSSPVNFTVTATNPVPTLNSLSPASANAGAGAQTLTLTGTNFLSSSTVTYNGVGHAATFISSTQLTISLSTGDQATAGSYPVVVTNPAPGGGSSSPVNFTVTATNPVPTLNSLSPASVNAGAGAQTLTLTGTNFLSSSTVTYNGVGHAATFVSSTQLTISLSTGDQATAGSYPVVVTNPAPGGGSSSPVNFTVTATNPVPTLNSLSPASANAGAGAQTLTLTGTNFLSSSTVTYNGVGHAATFISSTQLTISLSTGDQATAGSYPVVVTNPAPGGGSSSPVNFTVSGSGPAVSLSSTTLTFGSQYVGDSNTAPVVTLNNTGGSTLNITSIAVTGANAADFAETDTCGSGVAAGGSCTITVMFTPSLASLENAAVNITDNASDSPEAVTLSGTGMVAAGQFMVLSPGSNYLVNTLTGKPVFITGEQAFSLATNVASDSDIELYLSTRQSMGFNFIWVGATDIAYLVDYPTNALGQAPFNGPDFTNMNEPYWEHLDDVIQRAANHGFTVLLNPAFVGSGPWGCTEATGWCPDLLAASDATLTNFGAYLGNRYKSYPNIIWMQGGDNDLTDYLAMKGKMQDIVNGIRSADTVHLMTIENQCPYCASQDDWPGGPWNINFLYHDAAGLASAANADYTRSDYLPMFLGEDNLEGENTSPSDVGERTEAYQAVLGGATLGFQFGNCVIWSFGYEYPYCTSWTSSTQWKSWLNTTGAIGRMYLGELMRSREFWKMAPDINHTAVTAGYGSGDTVTETARSSDGQTIIAYIPNGSATTLTVNMSQITSASSTANCWWFNPSTGATTMIGTYATSGTQNFTPPDSNDWVLVIDAASAGLPAPGSADL